MPYLFSMNFTNTHTKTFVEAWIYKQEKVLSTCTIAHVLLVHLKLEITSASKFLSNERNLLKQQRNKQIYVKKFTLQLHSSVFNPAAQNLSEYFLLLFQVDRYLGGNIACSSAFRMNIPSPYVLEIAAKCHQCEKEHQNIKCCQRKSCTTYGNLE